MNEIIVYILVILIPFNDDQIQKAKALFQILKNMWTVWNEKILSFILV